jgi:hypothetical protein
MVSKGLIVAAALLMSGVPAIAGECQPSFRSSADPIETKAGSGADIGFRYILIRCRETLEAITSEEIGLLRLALAKQAARFGVGLEAAFLYEHYRSDVVSAVNASVGKEVVTDLFIYDFSLAEYRAKRNK